MKLMKTNNKEADDLVKLIDFVLFLIDTWYILYQISILRVRYATLGLGSNEKKRLKELQRKFYDYK